MEKDFNNNENIQEYFIYKNSKGKNIYCRKNIKFYHKEDEATQDNKIPCSTCIS